MRLRGCYFQSSTMYQTATSARLLRFHPATRVSGITRERRQSHTGGWIGSLPILALVTLCPDILIFPPNTVITVCSACYQWWHTHSMADLLSAARRAFRLRHCRYSFTSRMTSLNLEALSVPLTGRKFPLPVEIFLYS
jgi:hypothetical protein